MAYSDSLNLIIVMTVIIIFDYGGVFLISACWLHRVSRVLGHDRRRCMCGSERDECGALESFLATLRLPECSFLFDDHVVELLHAFPPIHIEQSAHFEPQRTVLNARDSTLCTNGHASEA